MTELQPVLACDNLVKHYQDGQTVIQVLNGVDLLVNSGDSIAIMGASGSGKSTLLHLLGGLDTPTSGTVHINGLNIDHVSEKKQDILRNKHLGFVYQFHHLLPEMDALENVCMPLLIRGDSVSAARTKSMELLEQVGLSERMHHGIGELSGGERQRVALARALVTKPCCVLADEPTGNLDAETAAGMLDLLLNMNALLNIAFVIVTHDVSIAKRMQKQMRLEAGELIAAE